MSRDTERIMHLCSCMICRTLIREQICRAQECSVSVLLYDMQSSYELIREQICRAQECRSLPCDNLGNSSQSSPPVSPADGNGDGDSDGDGDDDGDGDHYCFHSMQGNPRKKGQLDDLIVSR